MLTHAPCSVAVFGERAEAPPANRTRCVVVGIDGSKAALGALLLAESIARALDSQMVLIHAGDAANRDRADAVLVEATAKLAATNVPAVERVVADNPSAALVGACVRHAPAVLVVGDHGSGGFKRRLLGGTSWAVASRAPCPVVVYRASA